MTSQEAVTTHHLIRLRVGYHLGITYRAIVQGVYQRGGIDINVQELRGH